MLRFLLDEDVVAQVRDELAPRHEVRFVSDVLGSGTKDPTIRRYLRAMLRSEDLILITADNEFAGRCSQEGSRLPCLWLRDLRDTEADRVRLLSDVIEREAVLCGKQFFVEIRAKSYIVRR